MGFAAAVNAGGEEAAAKAVLTQDIDMKDVAWTPIGNGAYTTANAMTGPAFQGTFDGQGHAVRNLKIVVPADAAAGLGTLRLAEGRHGQEPYHRRRLVGRFDRGRDDGRGSRGRICL